MPGVLEYFITLFLSDIMAQLSSFLRCVFLVVGCVTLTVFGNDGCALDCGGTGTCTFGTATFNDQPLVDENGNTFDFLKVTEIDGQYCNCDEGWTDVLCSTRVDKCDNSDHPCFFGGVCVGGKEHGTNELVYVCDCRDAVDSKGTAYLGAYCQIPSPVSLPEGADPVSDSVVCDEVTMRFCLNGGSCVDEDSL